MTLYQLFTKKPTEEVVENLLQCFGLESLEDTKIFTKKDLKENNTIDEIDKLCPLLNEYYLPCKRKKYLTDLTYKKIITLLRQFIKCYDYCLYSKEKYIQGEKYLTYQLMSTDKKTFLKMRKKDDTMIVSFD
jgi:hypothetical protein